MPGHRDRMNRRRYRILTELLGARTAAAARQRCEATLAALRASSPPESLRILEIHRDTMILPAIALRQALEAQGFDPAKARDLLREFHVRCFGRTAALYRAVGRLPGFFGLLRVMIRWTMAHCYPEAGWKRRWIEDSPTRIAFDMESCHYRDVLQRHGQGDLLELFCSLDDLVYRTMSARACWRRTTTLARGGTRCDFCFTAPETGGQS